MRPDSERSFARLTVADVFCGAGGLSEGFAEARSSAGGAFDVAFGVDRDADCLETYRGNVLTGSSEERARKGPCRSVVGLTGQEILSAAGVAAIDVLVGGPNCQAVSTAGRRNLEDDRNLMFHHYVRLVEELQPRWFVMENVPGLTHANALPLLGEIFARFGELDGYEVAGDVLLAADFGVPQYRYRLFLVGTRTGLPVRFPRPTHFADKEPVYRTVADALSRSRVELTDHTSRDNAADLNVRRVRFVPSGGDWRDIPVELLPDRTFAVRTSDQRGAYGRLSWDAPAFTITGLAHNVTAGPFTHPDEDRALTAEEAAALQGFRSDFRFAGSIKSRFRQVGNAVPPAVATALAEGILAVEEGRADAMAAPRLTSEVVRAAVAGIKRLPVMTPRVRPGSTTKPTRASGKQVLVKSAQSPRDGAARATYGLSRLKAEAALPKNSWTGKRATAILGLLAGRDVDEIASELKISSFAAQRWYDEYVTYGPEGWRAYHTPAELLAAGDDEVAGKIKAAVELVRRPTLVAEVRKGTARAHMNRHLRRLIERFEGQSVNHILARLQEAGRIPGTMYVGDLLAVAGVLLDEHAAVPNPDAGITAGAR